MQRLWKRYLEWLDKDLSTKVFDNFKNMVLCALLSGTHMFMSPLASGSTGWGLITISVVLMLLNMSDGIRRLSRLRYHTILQILIVVIYVLVSERVVEMVWNYRAD
jgi:hypothetical protein